MARGPIPVAPVVRIARKVGAKRIGSEGKQALVEVVMRLIEQIGEKAAEYANMSGRATVMEKDITMAYNDLKSP